MKEGGCGSGRVGAARKKVGSGVVGVAGRTWGGMLAE